MLDQFRQKAYEASCLAESLWEDELQNVYGNQANAARYDRSLNGATPMLRALRDMKQQATETYYLAGKIKRNEIAA